MFVIIESSARACVRPERRVVSCRTYQNRKVVMPPSTAAGIATSAAANFANMPMTMRKKLRVQHDIISESHSQPPNQRAFGQASIKKGGTPGENDIPAAITRCAVSAARERNDAVILREAGHRRHGHHGGEHACEAVGQDAALDARFIEFALNLDAGDVARGSYVTDLRVSVAKYQPSNSTRFSSRSPGISVNHPVARI